MADIHNLEATHETPRCECECGNKTFLVYLDQTIVCGSCRAEYSFQEIGFSVAEAENVIKFQPEDRDD